jgi:hypothetical protein
MAHPDLDALLNALIPFAQQMLSKYGEFYPFGASIDVNGAISFSATDPQLESSQSQVVFESLVSDLSQKAANGQIKAAGICFDTRITRPRDVSKIDAICIHLEHREQAPVRVYMPYVKSLFGKFKYQELSASTVESRIFVRSGAA